MDKILVTKEDLSQADCGGGYREISANIVIDSSKSERLQRHALVYEILASYLEPLFDRDLILEITDRVCNGLDDIQKGYD